MTGSSLLPATIHNGKIFFLFGKESERKEETARGFSDFGGGMEPGETPLETALREGAEESTGFLGNAQEIKHHINNHGGIYRINHKNQYYVHIYFIAYDENLPKYYNLNHRFLWDNMNHDVLNKTKLFEKIEMEWFSYDDIQKRRKDFRPFYAEITDSITQEKNKIKRFLSRCSYSISLHKKTNRKKKISLHKKKNRKTMRK